ncbi:MAG: GNAT family N-acetyltransferase [Chloroflexota bacterium]
MTDLVDLALNVDAANFQLGNEVFSLPGGRFVRNRELTNVYDCNHVTDVTARTTAEIDALLAAADGEFAHAAHRRFDADHRTPPEFIARLLLAGGYERSDALVSVLEGELIGEAKPWDIRPIEDDAGWEALLALTTADFAEHQLRIGRPVEDAVARRLWLSKKSKQPPVQYWLACDGDTVVGFMNSWDGVSGVGQVEDLFTRPDYRKRGVATALIHHCVADCHAKGAGPVVIVADPTDTPKEIYARMGFRPVAVQSKYLKRLGG